MTIRSALFIRRSFLIDGAGLGPRHTTVAMVTVNRTSLYYTVFSYTVFADQYLYTTIACVNTCIA